jgi:hypothetical protein
VKELWSKNVKQSGIFSKSNLGRKASAETREKMRQKALARDPSTYDKNRIKTPEQLKKLWNGRENYQKIHGFPMTGKKHTEETKQKIREARLKRLNSSV